VGASHEVDVEKAFNMVQREIVEKYNNKNKGNNIAH